MAVLLALTAADLGDTKIILGEVCHLDWILQLLCLIFLPGATLLPCIVAPSEQLAILRDAHRVVHAQFHLFHGAWDLSDESWDGKVGGMGAQLAATE